MKKRRRLGRGVGEGVREKEEGWISWVVCGEGGIQCVGVWIE
jgi:hypothetical protein